MTVPPGVPGGAGPGARDREAREVEAGDLEGAVAGLLASGLRPVLVAGHDDGAGLRVVYLFVGDHPERRVELWLRVDPARPEIPSLAHRSFTISRFERELRDLFGIEPTGHPQPRSLVLHQHWPDGWHPMRRGAGTPPPMVDAAAPYPFVPVEGAGIYEIPVGPVHAGLIEPGHFRFWVVGETIVRMKARLWFVHKGVERLFEGRDLAGGLALAERISGDSAVAHGLAFCVAVEDAWGRPPHPDAGRLRVLLLELERVLHHSSDIGALCNDVGFSLAHARSLDLREQLLRLNGEVTGHRLLRGGIIPGGATVRRLPTPDEVGRIEGAFEALVDLATTNAMVTDRFDGTAVLSNSHAEGLGVVGVAARASGRRVDARWDHPLDGVAPDGDPVVRSEGDVAARLWVRIDEARASLRRIAELADAGGPTGAAAAWPDRPPPAGERVPGAAVRSGVGIVEAWRGMAVHRVEIDGNGRLTRVKVVDPSFVNWPALPVSLADTIVPDFPLANKSFNLSYAGNDL